MLFSYKGVWYPIISIVFEHNYATIRFSVDGKIYTEEVLMDFFRKRVKYAYRPG